LGPRRRLALDVDQGGQQERQRLSGS
jgi:hypothetical protein